LRLVPPPSPARAVVVAYVSALLMTAIDMQIVNVALPTLSHDFGAPLSDVQWTVIAYVLTLAVVIPASGWVGDRLGTKRTYLIALAIFTVASALCGAAQSLPQLIAARAVQGVGGGLLVPTGTAMLFLSALLYAISEGSVLGWTSPEIVASGIAGVVLLWAFAVDSLRKPDPILRLRLLRDPLLRSTNIVFALTTGVFLGSLYLTPIFLQQVMGQSPIESGTTTFLEAIGVAVGSLTFARLYPRFGPRIMCGLGAIALTVYLSLFLLVDASTDLWFVRALMFFGGLGNCAAFLAIQTSMFTHISSADTGHAAAIYNAQRQSSIAINIAIVTTIVAGAGGTATEAFHDAYLAATVLAAIGAILAWTLIDTGLARSTMGSETPAA
jgi:MFS family permease